MKLNIKQKILTTNNKPIVFVENENIDSEIHSTKKEMTVKDVLAIAIENSPLSEEESYLGNISMLNKRIIKSLRDNKDYIELKEVNEINFLKDLILKDIRLSNLIKSFVLDMIVNNGKFTL